MSQSLSEFLYSALLWGTLITGLLWWLRGRTRISLVRKLLWLPLLWIGLHTANAWYGFLVPISGRLVDADSGQPLAGVRVYAHWSSIPLSPWYSTCSGEQAHASDAEGRVAFRFVPYPSLVFGVVFRGLDPRVPGRVGMGKAAFFLVPLLGEMRFQRFAPGRSMAYQGSTSGCDGTIAPQFVPFPKGQVNRTLLPGEEHPFEFLFREACIERQPWTYTDQYMRELIWKRPYSQDQFGQWTVAPQPMPSDLYRSIQEQLDPRGCPPIGDACAYAVSPELHDQLCEFVSTERKERGVRP
ncbi:MAG: carboxypeptidase-like regulatory domain-containing protein [Lysobacterales bacterium]